MTTHCIRIQEVPKTKIWLPYRAKIPWTKIHQPQFFVKPIFPHLFEFASPICANDFCINMLDKSFVLQILSSEKSFIPEQSSQFCLVNCCLISYPIWKKSSDKIDQIWTWWLKCSPMKIFYPTKILSNMRVKHSDNIGQNFGLVTKFFSNEYLSDKVWEILETQGSTKIQKKK